MEYDAIRALLKKKKDCLIKIKTMTEQTSIDETAESADKYILLMSRREGVFREITSLDQAIADIQIPTTEKNLLKEINAIQKEIKEIVEQIIQFDRVNRKLAVEIKETLKKGLQDVHKGKASAKMYNHDVIYSEFSRFDSKS